MGIFKRDSVRVAVVQSRITQGDKERNMQGALALFEKAMQHEPQLVCFTQAFGTGINFIILDKMAESIPDGDIATTLSSLAKREKVHIAAGILERGDDRRISDASVLFGPEGDLLGKRRRSIRWIGEVNYISQGMPIGSIQTPLGKIGLLTGYDICFPQTCHDYFMEKVDILVCCAAIFEDLSYNIQQLCAARAMDNHCYFVLAGAIGEHQFANMWYMGHSAICCDPYYYTKCLKEKETEGMELLAKAGKKEEAIVADLFVKDLAKSEKQLPFHYDMTMALQTDLKFVSNGP